MTQHNHTIKFCIGVGGIYTAYMVYGVLQEKIFKTVYEPVDGSSKKGKFTFPFILLFTQCLFSTVLAFIVNLKEKQKINIGFYEKIQMGFFNCLSMLGSNTALQYMSYPLQALFKSCKVLSVLIVGLCFGKTNYPLSQYVCGVFVSLGIIGFNLLEETKGSKETQAFGIVLILISLFSDGMLAERQAELRQKYKPSSFQLMEMCSLYCFVCSLLYGLIVGQIKESIYFMMNHKGLLGCLGQVFIFFTIKHFGPVILAIVTTTRKFFTVLASILLFGHQIGQGQWACVCIVLFGVGFELYESYQKNNKPHPKKTDDLNGKSNENGKHSQEGNAHSQETNGKVNGKENKKSK